MRLYVSWGTSVAGAPHRRHRNPVACKTDLSFCFPRIRLEIPLIAFPCFFSPILLCPPHLVPLHEKILVCGFAKIYNWSEELFVVQSWIHDAFIRRNKVLPNHSWKCPYHSIVFRKEKCPPFERSLLR